MPEARCAHFVIARFNYFVLWSSASLSSYTAHIPDNKLVSEHYRDCNGNSSAHVQGRRQLDLLSGLCNTTLTYHVNVIIVVIHTRMRITGRFKGYFLSVHMANTSATGRKLLALL